MSNRDINKTVKELKKEQQQNDQEPLHGEIREKSWEDPVAPDKRSYQPTTNELDDDNPPEDDE